MAQDSAGKSIKIGDTVRYLGDNYVIKAIREGQGTLGGAELDFENTDVKAGEVSVDLVEDGKDA